MTTSIKNFTQYNEIKEVLDAICPILESWVIFETIDEHKCEYLLAEQGLSNDDIDLVMDLVNFIEIENKGVHNQLSEYIQRQEDEVAGWSTDCGHDLWLDCI